MEIILKQEVLNALTQVCLDAHRAAERLTADQLLTRLTDVPGVPVHYPYHHYIMPAVLLTLAAMETGKSGEELREMLRTAEERSKLVPGGFCGRCGACGAGIGLGIFISVWTGAAPLTVENWQWANEATGIGLQQIACYPGPRCCKRTCYLALQAGVPYANEKCGLRLTVAETIACKYEKKNPDCLGTACPFHPEQEGN